VQNAINEINAETGLTLRLAKFQSIKNPYQHMHKSLSDASMLWMLWHFWFKRYDHGTNVRLAVVPPFQDSGKLWIAGYSDRCNGKGKGSSYAALMPKNQDGVSRLAFSQAAIKHELGHQLGAADLLGCSSMDTGILYCPNYALAKFDNYSVQQIRSCTKAW
jgi:hypothetical protein